jgi:hypothetical protein
MKVNQESANCRVGVLEGEHRRLALFCQKDLNFHDKINKVEENMQERLKREVTKIITKVMTSLHD